MSAEELFAAVMISERRAAVHPSAATHSAMRGAVATRHRGVAPQDGRVLIALRLALAPAVALGCSRFAYALLLPDMRASLGWSYAAARALNTQTPPATSWAPWPPWRLRSDAVFSYGLFGAGYIVYMTFIVALLGAGRMHASEVALFWTVLGALAAVSAFGWGPLLVRLRGGAGPACVFTTVAVGAFFAILSSGRWGALGSAVLFGGAFMAGPASVSVVARRELTPATWQRAFGLLTAVFSIGQIVGPWLAGAISDAAHDVRAGLGLAVGLLVFAALIALGQRHTEQPLTGRHAPR